MHCNHGSAHPRYLPVFCVHVVRDSALQRNVLRPWVWRVRLNGVALGLDSDTPDRAALAGAGLSGFSLAGAAIRRRDWVDARGFNVHRLCSIVM